MRLKIIKLKDADWNRYIICRIDDSRIVAIKEGNAQATPIVITLPEGYTVGGGFGSVQKFGGPAFAAKEKQHKKKKEKILT